MQVITNQAATVNALSRAGLREEALAWEDPLTFGRLSGGDDLNAFASVRSFAFAAAGWDEDDVVEQDLQLRNGALSSIHESGAGGVLLFGGSLKDQLQLAQILSWLRSVQGWPQWRLALVEGPLTVFDDGALLELAKDAEPLSEDIVEGYSQAWAAVTGTDALLIEQAKDSAQAAGQLALATALDRWLRELPSVENGLSLTQAQILDTVRLGVVSPQAVFEAVQATEAIAFRHNWEFWQVLEGLIQADDPVLRVSGADGFLCPPKVLAWEAFHAQELELSERGRALLEGKGNLFGSAFPERWLGGIKIDSECRAFWDYAKGSVAQSEPTSL